MCFYRRVHLVLIDYDNTRGNGGKEQINGVIFFSGNWNFPKLLQNSGNIKSFVEVS